MSCTSWYKNYIKLLSWLHRRIRAGGGQPRTSVWLDKVHGWCEEARRDAEGWYSGLQSRYGLGRDEAEELDRALEVERGDVGEHADCEREYFRHVGGCAVFRGLAVLPLVPGRYITRRPGLPL